MISAIFSVAERSLRACAWLVPPWRAVRLSAYFGCIVALPLLLTGRALYAATREDAFGIGHDLLGLADLTRGAETVELNGERFHHAIASSSESLATVLDRVVEHCQKEPSPAARVIAEATNHHAMRFESHAPPGALRHAVFREQSRDRGMVLCFVGGPRNTSLPQWLAALHRFSSTRDLAAFGRLRYSFAEQAEGKTRVVTLWADTGLNLATLFPETGDAAGTDSAVLPRPPRARRTLSARAEGVPFAVRSYQLGQSVEEAQRFYDGWMSERGWQSFHDGESESSGYLRADGYQAFVSLMRSNGNTYVTVTETGRPEAQTALEMGSEP